MTLTCTTFTFAVTGCKLQGAVLDRDKNQRILPRILNYEDIKTGDMRCRLLYRCEGCNNKVLL